MDSFHNPLLEPSNSNHEFIDDDDQEILVKCLHMIWIGSELKESNSKNIRKWVSSNQGCHFDILIWYDSKLITQEEETRMIEYIVDLNRLSTDNSTYLCDIRNYPILELGSGMNVTQIYNCETGIWPRPFVNPIAIKIRNYGMASDVIRALILYWYSGFYVDIDMVPVRLCDYNKDKKVRSCPSTLCMTNAGISPSNNSIYYATWKDKDQADLTLLLTEMANRYELIKFKYYRYLAVEYISATIDTTGPSVYRDILNFRPTNSEQWQLKGFDEDKEQSTHTWFLNKEKLQIKIALMYDIVSDIGICLSIVLTDNGEAGEAGDVKYGSLENMSLLAYTLERLKDNDDIFDLSPLPTLEEKFDSGTSSKWDNLFTPNYYLKELDATNPACKTILQILHSDSILKSIYNQNNIDILRPLLQYGMNITDIDDRRISFKIIYEGILETMKNVFSSILKPIAFPLGDRDKFTFITWEPLLKIYQFIAPYEEKLQVTFENKHVPPFEFYQQFISVVLDIFESLQHFKITNVHLFTDLVDSEITIETENKIKVIVNDFCQPYYHELERLIDYYIDTN